MSKLANDQLKEIGIVQWADIQAKYTGSDLFLGNGFSIKISDRLNYRSLFQAFLAQLDADSRPVFEGFGTTNFEAILEKINDAILVNGLFGIPSAALNASLPLLRNGLVQSINQNHPAHHELPDHTFNMLSKVFDAFENIFSTNYDTFLYRIIMQTKDRYQSGEKIRPYQDYFWLRVEDGLQFMDVQNFAEYKNIYFLHGALFIFNTDTATIKIKRRLGDPELLELITARIQAQQFPLFVAEGTFQDKERAINRSAYLSFCRTAFKNTNRNLVVYGSSLSAQDSHLINDLNFNRRNLAISVRCQDKTAAELNAIKLDYISKFNRFKNEEIVLFDADGLF